MSKTLEFFFDLGSPATYLAYTQLPALCAATGTQLVYKPMLLGGVLIIVAIVLSGLMGGASQAKQPAATA